MIDITMCAYSNCLKFDTCYRAQSEPHPMFQEWLNVTDNNGCPFFINIAKYHPAWVVDEYGTWLGRVTEDSLLKIKMDEDAKEDRIAWKLCKTSSDMRNCDEEWGILPWEESV